MPARTRLIGFKELAEAQDHAALALIDDVEAAGQPHQQNHDDEQSEAAAHLASARSLRQVAAAFAAENGGDFLIQTAPQFVEVRRAFVAALAPVGIIQCHCCLLSSDRLAKGKTL